MTTSVGANALAFPPIFRPMQPDPSRTFIDDLVSYFDQKAEVNAAYFAFLYSSVSQTHDLFLGVEHNGALEDIQNITLLIKRVYLQDSPTFFASSEHDPDTFALVREQGLLFFSRQEPVALAQQLLQRLFDQQRDGAALHQAAREHAVYAVVDREQLAQRKLAFQPFGSAEEPALPLFTHPNMVFLGTGLPELPPGLTLAQITWAKHLASSPTRAVVLNPNTPFEARFEL